MSVKSSKGLAVLKLSEHCTNRRKTPPEDTTQFKKVEYPVYHVSYFINFHESSKRMLNSENINILFFIYFLYFNFSTAKPFELFTDIIIKPFTGLQFQFFILGTDMTDVAFTLPIVHTT
jgi:hypothetical protein